MPNLSLRVLLLAIFLGASFSHVFAAEAEEPTNTKKTVAMSQPVFEKLQKAQGLVEKKDYRGALGLLDELKSKKGLSAYENAQIWNLTAYIQYLRENYPAAIKAYERVLAQPNLPDALVQSTLKTQAQLYFTAENYSKALETAQRLVKMVKQPNADLYMLMGQAYYQLGKYRQALNPIRRGIDLHKAQGKKPKENWLLLMRVCYHEMKDYKGMVKVLKELIRLYPKDDYLLTLAAAYSELGNTKRQLTLTEALYEKGYLQDAHHAKNLANLYLMHGLPVKAAKLLEKEINAGRIEANERNLTLLSQSWYQAREDKKSIPPLERAAAQSGTGELYVRLGQSHMNLSQWQAAAEAVKKGLAKGGVRRRDTANVMLGMALFNQKQLKDARSAFVAASKDKRSAKLARQWLGFIDSEVQRRETMNQVLPDTAPREQDDLIKAIEG